MRASGLTRAVARHDRGTEPVTITAYVHRTTNTAWLDVTGEITTSASLRLLLSRLRRAHRRLPAGIEVVGLDLTRLDEIAVDLAVFLCLESRMLGVRGIALTLVLRDETETPQTVHTMLERLERLRIWRVAEDRLATLARAAAEARLEEQGWSRLTNRT